MRFSSLVGQLVDPAGGPVEAIDNLKLQICNWQFEIPVVFRQASNKELNITQRAVTKARIKQSHHEAT